MAKKQPSPITDEELKRFLESSIESLQPKIDALTEGEQIRGTYSTYEKGTLEGMQMAYRMVLIKKGMYTK